MKFLLTFLFVCVYVAAPAQTVDSVKRNISLSLGAAHYRLMDEAFSLERVKYRGTPFNTVFAWQRSTSSHLFNGGLQVTYGNVSPQIRRPEAVFLKLQMNAAYAKCVLQYKLLNTSSILYAGVQINSSNHILFDEKYLEEIVVSSFHTLDVVAYQHARLSDKNELRLSLVLPAVGFLKRTAYEGGANQEMEKQYRNSPLSLFFKDTKFSAFRPWQFPQFAVAWFHRIAPKTDLILHYQFNFFRSDEKAPVSLYSNSLSAGFRFNFNKQPR